MTPGERQAQGFRNRRKYLLEWPEDHELHGLQVRCRAPKLGDVIMFQKLRGLPEDQRPDLDEFFRPFADTLISWNLETEQGAPVPPTLAGMLAEDVNLMQDIVDAWMEATSGVSAPKEPRSNDGASLVEASLPMEPLSQSRAI